VRAAGRLIVNGKLLEMPLNDRLCAAQLPRGQASVGRNGNLWRQPEFRLAVGIRNVDMNASLLTGEEEQAELPVTYDRRCHHAMQSLRTTPRRMTSHGFSSGLASD
jgi:hypothetical protein